METIEIELSRLFVKVIQQGSFSRAAELLKIPKSTVSKAITRLEQQTGTKLLLRTTRSQSLTAAGRAFYETCLGPIQILEDAQKSLYGHDSIVSGNIKLTAPEDLGAVILAPVISQLCRKHPQLSFELQYTNHVVDLVKDGFDLAVRLGVLKESGLKVRRAGEVVLLPVASPGYLEKRERIKTPKDLAAHDCLTIGSSGIDRTWTLKRGRETAQVSLRPRIVSNQKTSLIRMANNGAGVVLVPSYLCQDELDRGKLVRVLPEWSGASFPCSILSPMSIVASARLKLVSDEIYSAIQKVLG